MESLEKAFEALKQCRLVWSQYEFSRDWLGRSKSYYAYLKSSNAVPSTDALATLVVHLDRYCGDAALSEGGRQSADYARLKASRDEIWQDITARASGMPRQHPNAVKHEIANLYAQRPA